MSPDRILPWHQSHWQRLNQQIESGKLPHALLIAGPSMSGKSQLTEALTGRLLCSEEGAPCGHCHQCQLMAAGTHPDLLFITLEEPKKQIVIDQIRSLIEWASQTAQQGGRKVCIINPAEKMNVQSANALLKCLEEPPAGTSILLVTEQPGRLLPTLRSRCQRVECHQPEKAEAIRWLEETKQNPIAAELLLDIAGGVPLRAQSVSEEYLALRKKLAGELTPVFSGSASSIQLAGSLARTDPAEVLDILYQLVADAVSYTMSDEQVCKNSDLAEEIGTFAKTVSLEQRFKLLDRITSAKGILGGTSNANPQMLFEWLLTDAA